ncbi:hypothetical protein HDU78_006982 [Chytriomyces hyalinus]|nr:hypothetical protein HDU78_006982 [Chytriomyces hyalinus]
MTSSAPSNASTIFTPYAAEWNLDDHQLEAALARAKEDGMDTSQPQEKLLLFLYAKGILAKESPEERKPIFNAVLHGSSQVSAERLKRLTTIVNVGEKSPMRATLDAKTFFDAFVELHPEWAPGEGVFVAHRDHPDLHGKEHALVERFQKIGLCYMHAPVVLQHYLVAMNNTERTPMLNIADFLKTKMNGTQLYHHIWDNQGGDSLEFLKSILAKKPDRKGIVHKLVNDTTDLTSLLKTNGPGLVSGFRVTSDFNARQWQHEGYSREGEVVGRHAMLLIGCREAGGKVWYLLQNWWKTKAYVEVDIAYLAASECLVHFVTEKQHRMGNFLSNYEEMVECEVGLDARENFVPEGMC